MSVCLMSATPSIEITKKKSTYDNDNACFIKCTLVHASMAQTQTCAKDT